MGHEDHNTYITVDVDPLGLEVVPPSRSLVVIKNKIKLRLQRLLHLLRQKIVR